MEDSDDRTKKKFSSLWSSTSVWFPVAFTETRGETRAETRAETRGDSKGESRGKIVDPWRPENADNGAHTNNGQEELCNGDEKEDEEEDGRTALTAGAEETKLYTTYIEELNETIPRHNKIITSLCAGAIAGATAKTVIAPLDRTKITFQISHVKLYSFKSALKFLMKSFKNDGFFSLWRGNSATMARIVPYASIQYASHEQWKHILFNNKYGKSYKAPKRFLAGSLAGVTSVILTYPLDLARARMAVTSKQAYPSLTKVFLKLYRTEGLRHLYRGLTPTVLGVIPYAGTSFYTYETLKSKVAEDGLEPTSIERLSFGALAGLFGQTSSYPLDIVRRRMQTSGVTGHDVEYKTTWSTLYKIGRNEGVVKGLYKGLSMNWIKGPIAVGTSFSTFDFVQRHLRRYEIFHDD